jgi:GMP synthase (glutamine-hydrolysing)
MVGPFLFVAVTSILQPVLVHTGTIPYISAHPITIPLVMTHAELLLILDYGSQYSQLIARRVRELGVYSELHPFNIPLKKIKELHPKGIILSGSPHSAYEKDAPISSPEIFELGVPILGICYGLQLIGLHLGGEVDKAARREYGARGIDR